MTCLKQIDIDSKVLFDKYLSAFTPVVSELTFTNLFMWREYYGFKYMVNDDYLYILVFPKEVEPYALMPIGEKDEQKMKKAILTFIDFMKEINMTPVFKKIYVEDLAYFKSFTSEDKIIYDRDNSDYLYKTEDLINLSGKKYHSKRNHISKFTKLYKSEYVSIDRNNIAECYRIMEEWCEYRDCQCKYGEFCERNANMQILDNYEKLGCKGALIKVNNTYQAFTIGEMLNDDTAVIHIEKANFDIHGLYAYTNQRFCKEQWKNTKYINREQDLGQEGLRKAKLSYQPIKLIEKYIVVSNK